MRHSETPDGQRDGFVYEEQSISTSGFRLVHVLLLEKLCFEKCLEVAGEEGDLVCTVGEEDYTICVCDVLCGCC